MKRIVLIACLLFICASELFSQSGMRFPELARRLEMYFNKEMIADIQNQFPQGGDYTVWGWDVGDFSGDGVLDAAFSVRIASQRGRIMQVFLFVDLDGYFVKVAQEQFEFVEIPLEIGVVIRNNTCYITRKNKQFDWLIRGYRFDNGSLIHLDEFTTKRIGNLTNESYRNFQTLRNTEKYLDTRTGRVQFLSDYMTIPSYSRGRLLYKGFQDYAFVDNIDYVPKGAFYWSGDDDLSYWVSSAYDDEFLYMTIKVKDDVIVPQSCDSCLADYVDVWFDMNPIKSGQDRFTIRNGDRITYRDNAETGLFRFTIYPGNYMERSASVHISTTDDLEAYQKIASRNVVAISDIQDSIYIIRFKVPFVFFGLQGNPLEHGKIVEYGCTVTVHDYDNEFNSTIYTEKTTSVFDPKNPATYGSFVLIPDKMWYGNARNIYQDDILKTLLEYGF